MPSDTDAPSSTAAPAFSDAWWDALAQRCAADPEFGVVSRHLACQVGVRVDGEEVVCDLRPGTMSWRRRAGGLGPSWEIALSGTAAAWSGFLADVPPPGHQDLFSLIATVDGFELLGDPLPLFQHVRAIQRWLQLFREGT